MSNSIEIGSVIKSFDFKGVDTCYIIGVVTAMDSQRVTCRVVRQVWEGVQVNDAIVFRAFKDAPTTVLIG